MNSTKEKILQYATVLFNQKGVNNVTLRDIAGEAGISPGNLAYHFRNQDYIIEAIFLQMTEEREAILRGVQEIPSFENINAQILPLLQTAEKYAFFHLDAVHILRNYPSIASMQRAYYQRSIEYVRAVVDLSVGRGTVVPQARPFQYDRLAHTVWMLMTFWLEQITLRGLTGLHIDAIRQSIWDLIIPFLTEKGHHQFQKLYTPTDAPHKINR